MAFLEDVRAEREKKIALLREQGMEAYPAESFRTLDNATFLASFDTLAASGGTATLAGRIMSLRDQGGIVFIDLFDGTARVQGLLKKDDMDEANFDLFMQAADAGDFVEVTGTAFTTKRGMNSLAAKSWRMLAKALRPMPDEWYGLKDEDERYRKRYLDILLNPEVSELIRKRSVFWNAVRAFMLKRGFTEVETPVLETMTGGAEARPFVTHHNALDIDVYLRISVGELWQKKLMVGGLPKTFEIGRIFRNEGMSYEHANDYTSFEFYEAYQDAREGVPMLIELYRTVAEETFGTQQFTIGEFTVDLSKEWDQYDFNDLMKKKYGFDPRDVSLADVKAALDKEKIAYEPSVDVGRGVDMLWKKIRKTIAGPAVMTGMPVYLEPLAKKSPTDGRVVERFQILLAGSEVGKAFNELNDPIDQRTRFDEQQKLRDAGDEEAQMADFEYVEAMEYGMPPMFGFGVSERLFSFLAGKSIREAQAFPLMRPKDAAAPKSKENKTAIAVVRKNGLESWQVLNAVAHLSAELGVRGGKPLISQDSITTADNVQIPLNIQHAIMLKEGSDSDSLRELLTTAKAQGLQVAAFTREMIETTSDKKVIERTAKTKFSDIDFLGVLVFGPISEVEALTSGFPLYT